MSTEILGNIACGFPSPGLDYREDRLDFNTYLIKHESSTYCLRASGSSMEPLIYAGDILVTDRSLTPVNGDIIIAEVDGRFTAKRLVYGRTGLRLCAENPNFRDIEFFGELRTFGVVTAIVRQVRRW